MMLAADAETRTLYPFDFQLTVDFVLDAGGLDMHIAVNNPSRDTVLPFMLGGHPGFAWPLPQAGDVETHRLSFSAVEHSPMRVLGQRLGPDDGAVRFEGRVIDPSDMDFHGLTHALSPVRSDRVTFGTDDVHVALSYEGFANLAIWRRDRAPFLCLEPWTNLPIAVSEATQFADLPDIERLAPGESRRFAMRIAPGGTRLDAGWQS
jgi:galactose mutarotase-like enzyme